MALTIFFVHRGNPFYLKYALAQARQHHPRARLILLGDGANRQLGLVDWEPLEAYWGSAREFERVYVHLSPNSRRFELFCFQRWLALAAFVRRHGLEGPVACLDSDTLVYLNLERLFRSLEFEVALTREIGPAFTLWRDARLLGEFASFLFESYTDDHFVHFLREMQRGERRPFSLWFPGYVADMHLLGLFARTKTVWDLSWEWEGGVFDYAFHVDEGFAFDPCKRIKRLSYDPRRRRFFGIREGRRIDFWGLHFQVGTKVFLPHHYTAATRFPDRFLHRAIQGRGYLTSWVKRALGRC